MGSREFPAGKPANQGSTPRSDLAGSNPSYDHAGPDASTDNAGSDPSSDPTGLCTWLRLEGDDDERVWELDTSEEENRQNDDGKDYFEWVSVRVGNPT